METKPKTLFVLHLFLAVYSVSGILSKLAAGYDFLSWGFIICYGGVLLLLAFYAIGWQQIIKRMPLTAAYANRAATVVWGLIWGILIFGEEITPGKIIGGLLVIAGIVLYSFASNKNERKSVQNGKPSGFKESNNQNYEKKAGDC